jgi:phosphosulfolactate synthase (CoM biosynthesis protein A)
MSSDRPFSFLPLNHRPAKPRTRGVTEIRGPYYSPMGKRYLADLLEGVGDSVDSLKFAGGSFTVMSRSSVAELIELCHRHDVRVSTGGFIERVLSWGPGLVGRYLHECRQLGFDTVEVSTGFIVLSLDDWMRLVERVCREGLEATAEVGIQFGAGGDTSAEELAAYGTRDPELLLHAAERLLDAGAARIMLESEGITENVMEWRTDVPVALAHRIGIERVMFEAADPQAFAWYVQTFGPEVNLFVDHSQIVQLEALRCGVWSPNPMWGRVVSYPGE